MKGESDFWSRRRAGVAAEERAEDIRLEAETTAEVEKAQEDKTDAELLEELDLPDPDTMEPGDNFSAFMRNAVPERLRRRALRKLWLSNPLLANVDGLIDYGEDFTDSAQVIENLSTTYQVGKGMLTHVLEMERQAEEAEKKAAAEEIAALAEPEEAELPEDTTLVVLADAEEVTDSDPQEIEAQPVHDVFEPDETDMHIPRPRRMRFGTSGVA
jgi:hypothetical protein